MPPPPTTPMTDPDREIAATVQRERARLAQFVRRRVADLNDVDDILQDVFYEFVEAYRLPASIEQAGAWLFRVARHRIIDRLRKKKELPLDERGDADDDDALRLDLALPSPEGGPDAQLARRRLLEALQDALDELPEAQREVFVAHEIDGLSFNDLVARTGVPLNTLLSRKRYAVLRLRERLQPIYDALDF